ncbi:type II toxin-antitoxin system YoeB family toxin [Candidatus Chloroploca sp. M-50]|uniref:Type II toxin-antitoxin system YoeB family toxin n=1 Tax=Candidatus Chloroploca mongolica TaxID=2528176 RepID=A0ABS4DCD1_9CHLR|nr:type II toxin-antitoxin system YoeB family toxin [Candidatus Chloroploca mongolica]
MRSLIFDPAAFEDLAWWVQQDRKKALRLIRLIQETQTDPYGSFAS